MRFPLIGSAVLFSLFLLFKVLPKVRGAYLTDLWMRAQLHSHEPWFCRVQQLRQHPLGPGQQLVHT